jgi:hypothetical protein
MADPETLDEEMERLRAVAQAAETIYRKWVAAYADLLIPAFDQGTVFGEEIDSEDIVALSVAIAAWRGEEPRWTGVRSL